MNIPNPNEILIERVDLQRLLKAVEDTAEIRDEERDLRECPHCYALVRWGQPAGTRVKHEPGCVVLRARELGTKLIGGAK